MTGSFVFRAKLTTLFAFLYHLPLDVSVHRTNRIQHILKQVRTYNVNEEIANNAQRDPSFLIISGSARLSNYANPGAFPCPFYSLSLHS